MSEKNGFGAGLLLGLAAGVVGGVLLADARDKGQLDGLRSRGIELKAKVGEGFDEFRVKAQEIRREVEPVVAGLTGDGFERELRDAEREIDQARHAVNGGASAKPTPNPA